ncbi:MAG TPA: DUF349 domain-containing protein [Prolixibacteraceae bacterium]|nr:DUF349 domain-containing protein [Prolixibacteraceae bacterium]
MESNKLTKDVTSEETGLLKNGENVNKGEAKTSVAIIESTDNENETTVEEAESSPIILSEPEHQPTPELEPEPIPELDPQVVPELVPEIAPELVPEIAPEIMPETSPEILPEPNLQNTLTTDEVVVKEAETQDIVSAQFVEDKAAEKEVQEPASTEATPVPMKEVSETALIDQIVQVPVETEDDDDLFSDREPDANAIPIHDYSSYSKIQLINTFRKILAEGTVDEIRPHAEALKGCFYKIRNAEIQEQKRAFTAEGNDEELFEPQADSFEAELKDLLREYKNLRAELNKKQEAVKEENYYKKLAIIEEIKSLINSEESINMTFQEFNNLQDKWKATGQVPQTRVKDLWENYHYHVELFYDFVKINRELRDLDLRRNMDEKTKLCIKAEELAVADADALSTFRDLQKLHEAWREIGPVPRDTKQDLWERFKVATTIINKRYQQFFEQERSTQKEQLQKKIELCELAEQYSGFTSDNPREWNDITEKVITLQEAWKVSGFGPRKENAKVWERFRAANDAFFQNKRNFWNKSKDQLNKNLALKLEICEQAEKLKDTEDWKATTDKLIALQKKWKEVGPVPRKQSELIWKRFRSACDEFFNRKTTHFSGVTGDQDENYKAKKALIADIEAWKPTGDAKIDIEILKKFQDSWTGIGFVPFRKKEELQARYHSLIDAYFDQLKLDDQDMGLFKFQSKIENLASQQRGWSKINMERDRLSQHLKQLESDINTLGNNVGFFGSSKGAQSLIQGVNDQMDKIKVQIDYLKAKLKIIDSQEEVN